MLSRKTAFPISLVLMSLALLPGAGSELYRGLAAVMLGGLLVATIFTVVLEPVVYSMFLELRFWIIRQLGREDQLPAVAPATPPVPNQPIETPRPEPVPVSADD